MGISKVFSDLDIAFMQEAIFYAKEAENRGEVPIGAVLVQNDEIIGRGWNQPILQHDPTAHAEIIALREGAVNQKNYRLPGASLYVTLEPCFMCAGAMVHARIERLVFGAWDLKSGAVVSRMRVLNEAFLNHQVKYQGGLLAEPCAKLLTNFFQQCRIKKAG